MKKFSFLFLTLLLAGCTRTEVPVLVVGGELTPELQEVQEAFNSIESKKDKILVHKLFAGAGEYLANCESMDVTSRFDPILGRVQSSYGWDREKYVDLTDAVSDYLVSVDYQEPKPLDTKQSRLEFAKIFQDLAEATKYE